MTGGIRVLYVDDEPDLLAITRVFLERSGEFEVDVSESAQSALGNPSIGTYDAIVSDYMMPGMNGIEFLKGVRQQFGDIPFILFTGRGREEVVIEAINNGANFYLQKGGDPKAQFAELVHKIRQAVGQRKAELSRIESEKRLADIINFLPDATFAIDTAGIVIAWNRAIEEMTGIPAAEMLGKGNYEYAIPFYGVRRRILIDLILEPDETVSKYYSNIIRKENTLTAETDLPHPREKRIHVLAKVSPLFNRQGEIVGAIESIRDITDHVRADEALRQAHVVMENSPGVLFRWMAREGWPVAFVSNNVTRFGYTPEELLSGEVTFAAIIHPDDLGRVGAEVEKYAREGKEQFRQEYRILARDGRECWVDDRTIVERDPDGRITHYQGILIDITESKRIEEALRRSEARTRWILDHVPFPLSVMDKEGVITFRNKRFVQVFGYTEEEVPTLHEWWQRAYPDLAYREQVIRDWESAVRRAEEEHMDIPPAEYRVTCRNGEERIIEISGIALDDGYLATFIDLTEKKRVEEALEKRLVALTQPLEDTGVSFEDLFDLDEIQLLQDEFAQASGVGMLLTRPDGTPITQPSNFCRLCSDIVRRTPEGRERCERSDSILGAFHEGGPFIHTCLSAGLWGAGATIVLGGRHIANWLIGQVRNETQNEMEMRAYAREIGIDSDDFVEAFLEVPQMSFEKFERIAWALHTLAHMLSRFAYQNVQQARFITEKEKAQEALRENEERFREIVEQSTDIFLRQDIRTGTIEYYSPKAKETLGYTPEEMRAMTVDEQIEGIHPDDRPSLLSFSSDVIEADARREKSITREFRIRKKEGGYCWVHGNFSLTKDKDGTPSMIIGSLHDISRRKQAEDALRESEEKYRRILENMQDAYFRVDLRGILTMVSPSAARMYGYDSADEMTGMPVLSLYSRPGQRDEVLQKLKEAGEGITDFTGEGLRKDGTTFWMSLNAQFFRDDEGRILGTEGIVRDISERRTMDQAIQQANRKLSLLNSITRHDIANQLTLIRGLTDMATMEHPGTVVSGLLSRIDEGSRTIERQIEFMKMYQEMGVQEPGWFRLEDIVARVGRKEVAISASCQKIEVFADPMLEKVFFNLFENAVQHGEHATKIEVRCEKSPAGLALIVEDNGIGISPGEKEKIFEKGYGKNTGLGLFLAKEILSITEISIRETGIEGAGARFEILVPKGHFRVARSEN